MKKDRLYSTQEIANMYGVHHTTVGLAFRNAGIGPADYDRAPSGHVRGLYSLEALKRALPHRVPLFTPAGPGRPGRPSGRDVTVDALCARFRHMVESLARG